MDKGLAAFSSANRTSTSEGDLVSPGVPKKRLNHSLNPMFIGAGRLSDLALQAEPPELAVEARKSLAAVRQPIAATTFKTIDRSGLGLSQLRGPWLDNRR